MLNHFDDLIGLINKYARIGVGSLYDSKEDPQAVTRGDSNFVRKKLLEELFIEYRRRNAYAAPIEFPTALTAGQDSSRYFQYGYLY